MSKKAEMIKKERKSIWFLRNSARMMLNTKRKNDFSASFLSLINPYRLKKTKESSTMLQETFDSCQEDGRSLFEIVSLLKFQQLLLKCQA